MLEDQDLQKIGKLIKDSEERIVENVIVQVGELLETNLLPDTQGIKDDIQGVKGDIQGMKSDIKRIDGTLKTLPDKDFVTTALGGVYGKSVARDKVLDRKVETLAETLSRRNTISVVEVESIRQMQVFARENQ